MNGNRRVIEAELLAIYDCPVCLETVIPPIRQCVRGHLICTTCQPKVPQCPLCTSAFSAVRALIAEQVLATQWLSCKFPNCPELLRCQHKVTHEEYCKLRPLEIVNLADAKVGMKKKGSLVRYEWPKVPVKLECSAKQFLCSNIGIGFSVARQVLFAERFIFCGLTGDLPQQPVRLTVTVWMINGQQRQTTMVSNDKSRRNFVSFWPLAELPDPIVFEVFLELMRCETTLELM